MCPLPPPGEWDDLLRARMALLSARGLRPQLHLPAADLPRLGASEAAKDAAAAKRGGSMAGAREDSVLASDLPEHVLETLEVFVMPAAQVAAELEAADAADTAGSSSGSGGGRQQEQPAQRQDGEGEEERSGRRMALLTTLLRLLELKALEMEGEGGERGGRGSVQRLLAVGVRVEPTAGPGSMLAPWRDALHSSACLGSSTAAAPRCLLPAGIPVRPACRVQGTRRAIPPHCHVACRPAGTGPLEADERLLAQAGDVLPRNQKHALLYRMGQKVRLSAWHGGLRCALYSAAGPGGLTSCKVRGHPGEAPLARRTCRRWPAPTWCMPSGSWSRRWRTLLAFNGATADTCVGTWSGGSLESADCRLQKQPVAPCARFRPCFLCISYQHQPTGFILKLFANVLKIRKQGSLNFKQSAGQCRGAASQALDLHEAGLLALLYLWPAFR